MRSVILAHVAYSELEAIDFYPTTIVLSRYGGTYEPGRWIAFPLYPEDLPEGYAGGDVECATFFAEYKGAVGGGDSPDAAYEALQRQIGEGRRP